MFAIENNFGLQKEKKPKLSEFINCGQLHKESIVGIDKRPSINQYG